MDAIGFIGDIGFIPDMGFIGFIVNCFVKAAGPSEKEASMGSCSPWEGSFSSSHNRALQGLAQNPHGTRKIAFFGVCCLFTALPARQLIPAPPFVASQAISALTQVT